MNDMNPGVLASVILAIITLIGGIWGGIVTLRRAILAPVVRRLDDHDGQLESLREKTADHAKRVSSHDQHVQKLDQDLKQVNHNLDTLRHEANEHHKIVTQRIDHVFEALNQSKQRSR